jgi:hypothetical protein
LRLAVGRSFWSTDGTQAGTTRVGTIDGPDFHGDTYVTHPRGAYFLSGGHLWATDGTVAGTTLVSDAFTLAGLIGVSSAGRVFARTATPKLNDPAALIASDGTSAGTMPLAPILEPPFSPLYDFVVAGPLLYFRSRDAGQLGYWATDGTPVGTQRLLDLPEGFPPSHFVPLGCR